MNNIVKFYPKDAAKNPDNVLEQAVGIYDQVLVIGYNKDGGLDARSSLNFLIKDIFFAIDEFKFKVLNGEYGHRPEEKDTE